MSDQSPVDESVDEGLAPPNLLGDVPDRIRVDDDADLEDAPEESEEPEVTVLTEEERSQFQSLLTIGRRIKKITVLDRPVIISSLNCDDEIRVGAKVKEHRDSNAFGRAYQCATVAASVQSVDGKSWVDTLEMNPDADVLFEQRWDKAVKLYPLVVQYIYQEIVKLDTEFAELAAKLGKL